MPHLGGTPTTVESYPSFRVSVPTNGVLMPSAEPRELSVQMAIEVHLPLEEPAAAGVHRVAADVAQVIAEVREGAELHVAVLARKRVDHVRGEPVAPAQDVCERRDSRDDDEELAVV